MCVSILSYHNFVVVVVVKKTRHSNGTIGLRNNRPHVTFRREGANTPIVFYYVIYCVILSNWPKSGPPAAGIIS